MSKVPRKAMQASLPKVTIGMPVYNGEATVRSALDSLLSQSFTDFELLISDNASTDRTGAICREYAELDCRIRYIRQVENVGGFANFKFVFDEARCEYFMWAACDDIYSRDFLDVNYSFLSENSAYVASTSPNGFEDWSLAQDLVDFSLDGEVFQRYENFFKHSFSSHGLFYSLIRTAVLRESKYIDQIFTGFDWLGCDWAVILCLASKGKVNRTTNGYAIFGVSAHSGKLDVYKRFNTSSVEWFFPFYRLSKFMLGLARDLTLAQRLRISIILLRLNMFANIEPLRWAVHGVAYGLYRRYVKPLIVRWRRG